MSTGDFPSPLRHFLTQLSELRSADTPDMGQVGRLLVELAADEEYLGPLIAELPSKSAAGKWLVKPERGPRMVLFHRPEGVMAYTHSHHCWGAVAPVPGVPPGYIHNHGHVLGTGPSPYSLNVVATPVTRYGGCGRAGRSGRLRTGGKAHTVKAAREEPR